MIPFDSALLREVSRAIAERMGLHFPEERWPDLARGLESAGRELGLADPAACARWLRAGELTTRQIETLASHLTVGETYFFRDPASFAVLEREILPPLIARRAAAGRTLRLWSAGCCTGEEAYSLAITCARALPDLRAWNVSILATDINPRFLAKAQAGVYSEWSFRGAPDWLRARFFTPASERRQALAPVVKRLVRLGYLNLAEDVYPSLHNHTNAMDVIFCRNVLMYLTLEHQHRVVAGLHRCLVDGGCLLVNPAEASAALFPMFLAENVDGVTLYRKASPPAHLGSWPGPLSPAPTPAAPTPGPGPLSPAPTPAAPTPGPAVRVAPAPPAPPAPAAPPAPVPPRTPLAAAPREDPLVQARECANEGRLEEALAMCQAAVATARTNPAAHFLHATICDELGRSEEAIAALGKVLYLDQDSILAHHALGGLYRRLGRPRESRRHLAVALGLLARRNRDEPVPEADGITCGRLLESVRAMTGE
jgi:chemotaxis protein methyltransferase CheR